MEMAPSFTLNSILANLNTVPKSLSRLCSNCKFVHPTANWCIIQRVTVGISELPISLNPQFLRNGRLVNAIITVREHTSWSWPKCSSYPLSISARQYSVSRPPLTENSSRQTPPTSVNLYPILQPLSRKENEKRPVLIEKLRRSVSSRTLGWSIWS